MIARPSAARVAASVILAGALLVGTAGCTFITPQATLEKYDPGDGVGIDVGDVQVRNAVAVANEDGDAISLILHIVNSGSRSANIDLQYQSDGEKTTVTKPVDAHEVLSFGNTDEDQLVITNPGVEPGALFPVYVQYGDHEGSQMLVPVLAPDTNGYEGLAPVAVAE